MWMLLFFYFCGRVSFLQRQCLLSCSTHNHYCIVQFQGDGLRGIALLIITPYGGRLCCPKLQECTKPTGLLGRYLGRLRVTEIGG